MQLKTAFSVALLLSMSACGGGGGGGSTGNADVADVAGTWSVNFHVFQNDCGIDTSSLIGITLYLVNQDGANVNIRNVQTGVTLTGGATEDGLVSGTTFGFQCGDGSPGTAQSSLTFLHTDGDRADVASVTHAQCRGVPDCNLELDGPAVRQ